MNYCLSVNDGYVVGFCSSEQPLPNAITDAERNDVITKLAHKPTAEEGYEYKLRADTLEWELVEVPPIPEPEPTPEEALSILLGGDLS